MKKVIITIIVVVLVIGGGALWFCTHNSTGDEGVIEEEGGNKVTVGEEEYFEPEYLDGNDANTLEGLKYTLPEGFQGIMSEDDSVIENLYAAADGTKLSISLRTGESADSYKALGDEYLDGAENIEEFDVNGNKAYKYDLIMDDELIESQFFILAGDKFYSGLMFHPEKVKDETKDEPDPIPLTEEQISSFKALCDSLSFE